MALKGLGSLEDEDHEDDYIDSVVPKTQRRKNAFKYFITLSSQALRAQNLIATLYQDLAYDFDFLIECQKDVITTYIFTKGLIFILKQVQDEGRMNGFVKITISVCSSLAQRRTLAIQRSDYMCHKDPFSCEYTLKQIEVNNIAASMGAHAERVSKLHRRAIFELGYDKETIETAIPKNEPVKLISKAIYKAWKLFSCCDSLVLVVVEDESQNQIDQRHVEYGLEGLGIPVDQIVQDRGRVQQLNTDSEKLQIWHLEFGVIKKYVAKARNMGMTYFARDEGFAQTLRLRVCTLVDDTIMNSFLISLLECVDHVQSLSEIQTFRTWHFRVSESPSKIPYAVSRHIVQYFIKNSDILLNDTNIRTYAQNTKRMTAYRKLVIEVAEEYGFEIIEKQIRNHFDHYRSKVSRNSTDIL